MNTLTLSIDEFAASARYYKTNPDDLLSDQPTALFSSVVQVREPWSFDKSETKFPSPVEPPFVRVLSWQERVELFGSNSLPWRPSSGGMTTTERVIERFSDPVPPPGKTPPPEKNDSLFYWDFISVGHWTAGNHGAQRKFKDGLLLYLKALVTQAMRELEPTKVDQLCVFIPIANAPLLEESDDLQIGALIDQYGPTASQKSCTIFKLWSEATKQVGQILGFEKVRTIESHQAALSCANYLSKKKASPCTAIIQANPSGLSCMLSSYSYGEDERGMPKKCNPVRIPFLQAQQDTVFDTQSVSTNINYQEQEAVRQFLLNQPTTNSTCDYPSISISDINSRYEKGIDQLVERLKNNGQSRWENIAKETIVPSLIQNFDTTSIENFSIIGNLTVLPSFLNSPKKSVFIKSLQGKQAQECQPVDYGNDRLLGIKLVHEAAFIEPKSLFKMQGKPVGEPISYPFEKITTFSAYANGSEVSKSSIMTVRKAKECNDWQEERAFSVNLSPPSTKVEKLAKVEKVDLVMRVDKQLSGIEADINVSTNTAKEIFVHTSIDDRPIQPELANSENVSFAYSRPGAAQLIHSNSMHGELSNNLKVLEKAKRFDQFTDELK